jgi:hypothetical protein
VVSKAWTRSDGCAEVEIEYMRYHPLTAVVGVPISQLCPPPRCLRLKLPGVDEEIVEDLCCTSAAIKEMARQRIELRQVKRHIFDSTETWEVG